MVEEAWSLSGTLSVRAQTFRDDAQRAATRTTAFDVDVEDALEALHPAHGGEEAHGVRGRLDEPGWGRCGGGV